MKTLMQRLKPEPKEMLHTFSMEYPTLGERIKSDLNKLDMIGDIRLTVAIDMTRAFKLSTKFLVVDLYECFNDA